MRRLSMPPRAPPSRAGAEIVDDNMSREGLYVGASRGSDHNTIYVVTHDDGDHRPPAERPDRLAVLAEVMEREAVEASATEVMRAELAAAESLARLEPIWADVVEERTAAEARQQLLAAVDQDVARQLADRQGTWPRSPDLCARPTSLGSTGNA